jgi:hypothetical protein
MTRPGEPTELRVSDADRNGTLRRLHNAVALGLIDIGEFEQRASQVSGTRTHADLDSLVGDLPRPGAIVASAADRVELRGWAGSLNAAANGSCPPGWHWCAGWARVSWTWCRPASPGPWSSSSST